MPLETLNVKSALDLFFEVNILIMSYTTVNKESIKVSYVLGCRLKTREFYLFSRSMKVRSQALERVLDCIPPPQVLVQSENGVQGVLVTALPQTCTCSSVIPKQVWSLVRRRWPPGHVWLQPVHWLHSV